MCINVLYVLVPVLVHVLLDGSGHDSAEIDGTVERHATSAPTKQPVPAPRHFTTKSSAKADFRLDFGDATRTSHGSKVKKAIEPRSPESPHESPDKSSPKSKIPIKIRKNKELDDGGSITGKTVESDTTRVRSSKIESHIPLPKSTDLTRNIKNKDESSQGDRSKTQDRSDIDSSPDKDAEIENLSKKKNIESGDMIVDVHHPKITESGKTITRVTTTIVSSSDRDIDPEKLNELMKTEEILKTVKTVTTTSTVDVTESEYPVEIVKRETKRIVEVIPDHKYNYEERPDSIDLIGTNNVHSLKTQEDGTVVEKVTTIRHVTDPSFRPERLTQSMIELLRIGDDSYFPSDLKTSECEMDSSLKAGKSEIVERDTWTQAAMAEYSSINNSDQWETHLSLDTSPGSGNGDMYIKNDSSRHELNSDTDSEGSPRRRRRSPCKRRTLGSSSGSDVALHEGAELSPLEDDQGTALTANLLSKQCTNPANQLPRIRNCVRT